MHLRRDRSNSGIIYRPETVGTAGLSPCRDFLAENSMMTPDQLHFHLNNIPSYLDRQSNFS
jgi:hypothetical protein